MFRQYHYTFLGISAAFLLTACSGDGDTGLDFDCSKSTLSYENFGKSFMSSYCVSCHSASAGDRRGAPSSINYDTQTEVESSFPRVLVRAGTGNTMPPRSFTPLPSDAERTMLAEWITCATDKQSK